MLSPKENTTDRVSLVREIPSHGFIMLLNPPVYVTRLNSLLKQTKLLELNKHNVRLGHSFDVSSSGMTVL